MVTSHLHLSGPVLSHVNYRINSSVSFVVPLLADSKKKKTARNWKERVLP
jgi:hypothetical protein